MYVPVQYVTLNWSPPKLTPEEEIAMGEQVARLGKAHFRREFRKRSKRSQASPEQAAAAEKFRSRPTWYRALVITGFIGMVVVAFIVAPAAMLMIFPITAFILLMYFGSLGIAVWRFNRWLSRCLSRFQESQRKQSRL